MAHGLTMILQGADSLPLHRTHLLPSKSAVISFGRVFVVALLKFKGRVFVVCTSQIQSFNLFLSGALARQCAGVLLPSLQSWDYPALQGQVMCCVAFFSRRCLSVLSMTCNFSLSGDWPCPNCHNVNWAKRDTCNMCNTPRLNLLKAEGPREGRGGGYMEREEVAKKQFNDEEEEYDEFGRKKKKASSSRPYYGH